MRKNNQALYTVDKEWAQDEENYRLLQQYAQGIQCSRRKLPIAIQRAILRYKGDILRPSGESWVMPFCCHLVFEPSNRWFSDYIESDDHGQPKYKSITIERLIYIDLARQFEGLGIDVWSLAD